jgi:hypothetical protein
MEDSYFSLGSTEIDRYRQPLATLVLQGKKLAPKQRELVAFFLTGEWPETKPKRGKGAPKVKRHQTRNLKMFYRYVILKCQGRVYEDAIERLKKEHSEISKEGIKSALRDGKKTAWEQLKTNALLADYAIDANTHAGKERIAETKELMDALTELNFTVKPRGGWNKTQCKKIPE